MRLKGEITWSPFGGQRALNRPLLAVIIIFFFFSLKLYSEVTESWSIEI